jgi:polyhydroxyalkanoate synthesis regulator phasin
MIAPTPKNFAMSGNSKNPKDSKGRSRYLGVLLFLVPVFAMVMIAGAGSLQLFVDVKQPTEQVKMIIEWVKGLISKGALSEEQGKALVSKLDAAKSKIEQNDVKGALSQFQSFINQVNGFVKAGQMDEEEGRKLIDSVANMFAQLGFKPVEMLEVDRGLHATKAIDLSQDSIVALAFTKNASPKAQIDFIEFTAASGVTSANLDIMVYNELPSGLPRPSTDDLMLFMDISLQGDADFSSEGAYAKSPRITFTVEKDIDGTCKDLQLFLYNEITRQWESQFVSRGVDNGPACTYEGAVPHFSMYAIGVKKPTGGGGVGSGGSGAGGGPAMAMDFKGPTITAYFWDPEFPRIGSNLTINTVIMDNSPVEATLYYYGPGETFRDSHAIPMRKLHTNWYTADIPGEAVKVPGVFFLIVAEDTAGNSARLDTKLVRIQELARP